FPFHSTPPTAISTLSLHDALPICFGGIPRRDSTPGNDCGEAPWRIDPLPDPRGPSRRPPGTPVAPHRGLHRLVELLLQCGILCRSEEHTSELQSLAYLVCRLLLEK